MSGQTPREHSRLSKALGIVVLAERNAAGLSREQLEDASGVSYSTIRRIEAGERVPNVTQINAIAAALGVRSSHLLALAEERVERDTKRPRRWSPPKASADADAVILEVDLDAERVSNHTEP